MRSFLSYFHMWKRPYFKPELTKCKILVIIDNIIDN